MDYEANGLDEKSGSMNWKYGVGIYRKEFIIDKSNKNRIISLLFDGVYQDATVYLNGEKLGNNYYGYIPFEFDITNKVNIGEVNTLLVRVDNSAQPNTRWYSGSGITRDVWISSLPPIHVASNGTYIVTDSLENNIASLSITTEISNSAAVDSEIEIKNKIYSPDGLLIASMSEKMTIGTGLNNALIKQNLSIRNALLWSPEHPCMHQMITEIIVDGIIEDQYVTPFGIRTLYFDADKGLLINKEHIKIHGMAIHNEAGQLIGCKLSILIIHEQSGESQDCKACTIYCGVQSRIQFVGFRCNLKCQRIGRCGCKSKILETKQVSIDTFYISLLKINIIIIVKRNNSPCAHQLVFCFMHKRFTLLQIN